MVEFCSVIRDPDTLPRVPPGYGSSADIWSLGVLLWELATEGKVENYFIGMAPVTYCKKLEKGERLQLPSGLDPEFTEIVNRCWRWLPEERPTAREVADVLRKLVERHVDDAAPSAIKPLRGRELTRE